MIALKQLQVANKSVLGIQVLLPNITMYYIVYQHHILCDESLDLVALLDRSPNISVMQVKIARSFEDLLQNEVMYVSPRMGRSRIQVSMKGQDALEALP